MRQQDTSDELMTALMKHRARLDRWLRRFGIDDADRPDIIQRAMEKVWLSSGSQKLSNDVGGLLHTAAKNLAIDHHREMGTRMQYAPLTATDDSAPPNPEDELHKQRLWMCVNEAIHALSERSAGILYARFFDELSMQELAQCFDMSLASAYRAVNTALEELERELKRRGVSGALCIPLLDRALAERSEAGPSSDKYGAAVGWSAPTSSSLSSSAAWRDVAKYVIGAVVGGTLVYLLLSNQRTPPPIARIPRYDVTIVPAAHSEPRMAPMAVPTMVCPEVIAAQPPPPPGKTRGPAQPEPNAIPRLLAQTCQKAIDAHDCDTARRICPQVPGSFGALIALQRPCTVAE